MATVVTQQRQWQYCQNHIPTTDYYYAINGWNEWRNGMSMTMSLGEGAHYL